MAKGIQYISRHQASRQSRGLAAWGSKAYPVKLIAAVLGLVLAWGPISAQTRHEPITPYAELYQQQAKAKAKKCSPTRPKRVSKPKPTPLITTHRSGAQTDAPPATTPLSPAANPHKS